MLPLDITPVSRGSVMGVTPCAVGHQREIELTRCIA